MLKLHYAAYFSAFGIAVPFLSPYLFGLGLSGRQVALVLSAAPTLHLGVPLLWGWWADRGQRPEWVLRTACVGAALMLVPFLWTRSMPWLFVVYLGHQFFSVPILGLTDAITLARVGAKAYAPTRLWGSASFLVATFVCGFWLTSRDRPGDPLVPALMVGGFALCAVAAFTIGGTTSGPRPQTREIRTLMANPRFVLLLAMAPLHWATMATYHGYLGKLILDRGHASSVVGVAFVVAVLAEIAVFFAFARLRKRFSIPTLLVVATFATAIRWTAVALAHSATTLVLIQLLHAFSFALYWASAMAWMAEIVPSRLRATGQAIYTTLTFGIGNLIGLNLSGWIYDTTGGAKGAFFAASAIELIPLGLALAALLRPQNWR